MSERVARVSEVISGSSVSFDDAIKKGLKRATSTLRNIVGLKVKEFRIHVEDGEIEEYRVNMDIIFLLEE
ncbi:MAG: dodecin domain-containing protein [Deltaproteobacteria bacterium]|uniref:Dodecin domain-containing protein n=1 Tax=Candidatus Zymogenus saltonus TaxID=2844893 RepID=A0A9D8K9H3_9DELT|nr:dodecin domain-containing protein [Candidatus Zymogenus saltonus]